MIQLGTVPPIVTEIEAETTDRFGNVLPTIIVKPEEPEINWKSYDYADAFLSKMTSPTTADEIDIHQLTSDLASIGTLSKFLWLAPYIGGNAADHALNLCYPYAMGGNKIKFVGSAVHNSDGIQGGTGVYAKNGICLSELDPENFSMGLYSLDSALTTAAVMEMGFGRDYGNFVGIYLGNNSYFGSSPFFSTRNYGNKVAFSLTDASGQFDYVMNGSRRAVARNGSIIATSATFLGWYDFANDNFTFLSYAGDGTGNTRRIAMHYIGEHFSDTELADNYDAFQAFQTSRGREV